MVSIHNTQKYHNYLYDFPEQQFIMIQGSILSFLKENEPHYHNQIMNDFSLKTKLNGSKEFTLFVPINSKEISLHDYLFSGMIRLDNTDKIIQNINNNRSYTTTNKSIDQTEIVISNIQCEGGMIHLINL